MCRTEYKVEGGIPKIKWKGHPEYKVGGASGIKNGRGTRNIKLKGHPECKIEGASGI